MRLLLDTSALIYAAVEPERLSPSARSAIEDSANALLVSAVSAYEVSQKHRLGKLAQFAPRHFLLTVERLGAELLAIHAETALAAGAFPGPHRDPWDRLIAAQAVELDLTVVTPDVEIARFGARVLW